MSKLTNEFKTDFALLLTVLNIQFTSSGALNYSETLMRYTLAGLKADGKIEEKFDKEKEAFVYVDTDGTDRLSRVLNVADSHFREAMEKISIQATPGRKEWAQAQIAASCYESDRLLFPLALAEGLLDLKDATHNALTFLSGSGVESL